MSTMNRAAIVETTAQIRGRAGNELEALLQTAYGIIGWAALFLFVTLIAQSQRWQICPSRR